MLTSRLEKHTPILSKLRPPQPNDCYKYILLNPSRFGSTKSMNLITELLKYHLNNQEHNASEIEEITKLFLDRNQIEALDCFLASSDENLPFEGWISPEILDEVKRARSKPKDPVPPIGARLSRTRLSRNVASRESSRTPSPESGDEVSRVSFRGRSESPPRSSISTSAYRSRQRRKQ